MRGVMMDVEMIQTMISTIGFPIFVAVWMLYKTSKDSEKMDESIQELKNAITQLTTLVSTQINKGEDNE